MGGRRDIPLSGVLKWYERGWDGFWERAGSKRKGKHDGINGILMNYLLASIVILAAGLG